VRYRRRAARWRVAALPPALTAPARRPMTTRPTPGRRRHRPATAQRAREITRLPNGYSLTRRTYFAEITSVTPSQVRREALPNRGGRQRCRGGAWSRADQPFLVVAGPFRPVWRWGGR